MKSGNLKKIGRAFLNGLASGINIDEAQKFQPSHHEYGRDALAHDFARVGHDIYRSMGKVDGNINGSHKVNPTTDAKSKVPAE